VDAALRDEERELLLGGNGDLPLRELAERASCVDLPVPSSPSSTMNVPRFTGA
jgi:hypothetical protein